MFCDLAPRQRKLYKALRANISVHELLERAANLGDAISASTLLNLVMQFRKVCNHPELFERADVRSPFAFARFGHSGRLSRYTEAYFVPDSCRNPIEYHIPELVYADGGILSVPGENARVGSNTRRLQTLMNIWTTDWMAKSVKESGAWMTINYSRMDLTLS